MGAIVCTHVLMWETTRVIVKSFEEMTQIENLHKNIHYPVRGCAILSHTVQQFKNIHYPVKRMRYHTSHSSTVQEHPLSSQEDMLSYLTQFNSSSQTWVKIQQIAFIWPNLLP